MSYLLNIVNYVNFSTCPLSAIPAKKNITLTKSPGLQCSGICGNYYHAACVGLRNTVLQSLSDDGRSWRCVDCREIIGSPNKSIVISDSVVDSDNSDNSITLNSIHAYVKSIDEKLNDYQTFIDTVKFCRGKVTEFGEKINVMEKKN